MEENGTNERGRRTGRNERHGGRNERAVRGDEEPTERTTVGGRQDVRDERHDREGRRTRQTKTWEGGRRGRNERPGGGGVGRATGP